MNKVKVGGHSPKKRPYISEYIVCIGSKSKPVGLWYDTRIAKIPGIYKLNEWACIALIFSKHGRHLRLAELLHSYNFFYFVCLKI